MNYAELQVTTNYSFLRGASHADELFSQATKLGINALGVVDRHSLAGIVKAHLAAKDSGVRLVAGCRLDLTDGTAILVYPRDRAAYGRLCRLLTLGKSRAGKGACTLTWEDLVSFGEGLIAVLIPDQADTTLQARLERLRSDFTDRSYMAFTLRRRPNDAIRLQALSELAATTRIPTIITNDVLYHIPERRILQDVLTCIREKCTIDKLGFKRERFADRWLKSPAEMSRLFLQYPGAIARTQEIVERCKFSLDELRYQYPAEIEEHGLSTQATLEKLTWQGATRRYPEGVPDTVGKQLRHELQLIRELEYAPYFLTVHNIVRYARKQGILCQGRGSAANSAVCFVLGITSIDPERNDLLFERFVSQERREPPDIDVDFEHERREEVIQWIYQTYGLERAALTATVIRYRSRGAVRDVGKALGLPEDVTKLLASQVWGWSTEGVTKSHANELNLNLADRRLRLTLELTRELIGFPRHLSQHPGGFVLTQDRLDELVPIEPARMPDRQIIEWDKDDIDILRFMKVDVLGLGMLGCMRRSFDLLSEHKGVDVDLATIPPEDPATYAMIRKADTIGTFQIESRAQMSMLPRLKPKTFYDLVIEVAIVRPGPIQGDMVHPYLRRREGKESVCYPTPELEQVLGKTLGVPLFQEQAMRVAIVCADFSPSEADQLRRAMATFRSAGSVTKFYDKLVGGMVKRGYDRDFAERTFRQLEGFGSYGFPESHAASFALIAYASSWMKCHHPDVFCCALLNAQPMGFYAPAQIMRDAIVHGVEIRSIDINKSRWDCALEPASEGRHAVRLGFRMVRGLKNAHAARVVTARGDLPYDSIDEIWHRAQVPITSLKSLAKADAYRETLGLDRRQALWNISALSDTPLPLFAAADAREGHHSPEIVEPTIALQAMTAGREVVEDYGSVGFTLRPHPVSFLREDLARRNISCASTLLTIHDGASIDVAGLVLVRQRPGSANGVMFMTIEDETAAANIIVWPSLFEKQRRLVLSARMLTCRGRVQREGDVIHIIAERLIDLSYLLSGIAERDQILSLPLGRGDEARTGGGSDVRHVKMLGPKSRDIYIQDHGSREVLKQPTRDFH